MSQAIDCCGEGVPFFELGLEQLLPGTRQAVVLARRSIGGLLPGGIDDTFTLQAPEEWIQGALWGGERLAERSQRRGELIAIARAVGNQRQHAQLKDAAPRLS